ncbi:MAG: glycosyltransferase family 9 protein [Elusimicrobiales bacterium]|nr:glycosyltransferase family 9 protein [Elusimicrobiales bacterium]
MKNILVIRTAGLGDMILTLSAVSPIKRKYPNANIYFLTDTQNLFFLKNFNFVKETFEYKRGLRNIIKSIDLLKKINIDIIINFERGFKKTLISYLIHSPIRIGYDIFLNNFFNTHFVKDFRNNLNIHMRKRYYELTKVLDLDCYDVKLEFTPNYEAVKKVEDFLLRNSINEKDIIIGINPVTGFKSKYWINERWAKVADYLIEEQNAKVILTYGPSQDQLDTCLNIISLMKNKPILSFKTDLVEFGALLKKLDFLICLDSGPFHFAVSLGIPTVSLWGRGNLKQWGPEGNNNIIITKNVECSPCNKFECENTICMSSITVDDVIKATDIILKSVRELKKQ